MRFIIYTDLDGTLLDHQSYEFDAAKPALQAIRRQNIPLILTSSKTRLEIERLRHRLDNNHPFIAENGGAIYIPTGYFRSEFAFDHRKDGYCIIELAIPYSKLRRALLEIREETGIRILGFGDLDARELAKISSLPLSDAKLALKREYDEPLVLEEELERSEYESFKKAVENHGLELMEGGRFLHLIGESDKGKAAGWLMTVFRNEIKDELTSVAIGDSTNDLAMLEAVDLPILVEGPNGKHDEEVQSKIRPRLAEGIGPKGWNKAVLEMLLSE